MPGGQNFRLSCEITQQLLSVTPIALEKIVDLWYTIQLISFKLVPSLLALLFFLIFNFYFSLAKAAETD